MVSGAKIRKALESIGRADLLRFKFLSDRYGGILVGEYNTTESTILYR